jgi:multiple sugar transport system substrate-binding protein
MSERALRIALVGGEAYDRLYEILPNFERAKDTRVQIAYRAPHPQLNEHLASLSEIPYDLVSTHTKYAPSQAHFLASLDDLEDRLDCGGFYPSIIELARVGEHLLGIPRNLDIKLLHYRTDLLKRVPSEWDELVTTAKSLSGDTGLYGFVFPGKESGLFGFFFELSEMAGVRLFPQSNEPHLNNAGGQWAMNIIRELYHSGTVPAETVAWHYDEAHRCFRSGAAAMICDWPGYYGAYCASPVSRVCGRFAVARMPAGPTGIHKAYAGAHTFALTRRGIEQPAAIDLLRFLTAPEQQLIEARQGSVPPRPAVLSQVLQTAGPQEAERWKLLDQAISDDMLIPPKFSYYPEIEGILWRTVRSAMTGEIGIEDALEQLESRIRERHQHHGLHN